MRVCFYIPTITQNTGCRYLFDVTVPAGWHHHITVVVRGGKQQQTTGANGFLFLNQLCHLRPPLPWRPTPSVPPSPTPTIQVTTSGASGGGGVCGDGDQHWPAHSLDRISPSGLQVATVSWLGLLPVFCPCCLSLCLSFSLSLHVYLSLPVCLLLMCSDYRSLRTDSHPRWEMFSFLRL